MTWILLAAVVTLGLSLALPFVIRPLLIRWGVMDVPTARSSHERPALRGLGLSVLIALLAGGSIALVFLSQQNAPGGVLLTIVLVTSLAAALLGLGEDFRGVSVAVRSSVLLAISLGAAGALVMLGSALPGTWIAALPMWALLLLLLYGVLFLSSFINVANFMDGLNGISGFHGVVAGVAFAAAGALSAQLWLLAAGALLAAAFLGFLPWNFSSRGGFLGDVGSYLLGGATAVTSFAALISGVPVLATIGPMIIAFGDVGVTLVKRVRAGHRWDEPHKEHVYQRIQQLGYTHAQSSAIVAAFSVAAAVLGLCSFFLPPPVWFALLGAGLLVLIVYLRVPRVLPRRVP